MGENSCVGAIGYGDEPEVISDLDSLREAHRLCVEQGAFNATSEWDEEQLLSTAKGLSLWKAQGLRDFKGNGLELLRRCEGLEKEFWARRPERHFHKALAARIKEQDFKERYVEAMKEVDKELEAI